MAKRTTEAVLRQEVRDAEKAVATAERKHDAAKAAVAEAIARRDVAKVELDAANAAEKRAEAALAAYLPDPKPGAEEASGGDGAEA